MTGHTLAHYRIMEVVGSGGMGVLYRAFDTHLERVVAIKVLRPEGERDPGRKRRFVLEAKAASALNHPHIVTIHDVDHALDPEGRPVDFIVMEFVEGQSLNRLIPERGLPLNQALAYAQQIAGALAAAHAAGIVHRDIKPANIMVTGAGHVKVLDFGLAKLRERVKATEESTTVTMEHQTEEGAILGTVSYMSPEQAQGKVVDARSDVFSLGVVAYEMLAGKRPFPGQSPLEILSAIMRVEPPPLKTLRPDVPDELDRIVDRSLEKDCALRYASAGEVERDLAALAGRLAKPGLAGWLRRPLLAAAALLVLLSLASAGTWWGLRLWRAHWARSVALPEISRLEEKGFMLASYRLAQQAARYLPDDPRLQRRLLPESLTVRTIRTNPPGASLYARDYFDPGDDPAGWQLLGISPLENLALPYAQYRVKIAKPGFVAVELAMMGNVDLPLYRPEATPAGMIFVPSGSYLFPTAPPVPLQPYWLDKYEVTNREFKSFVDRGGYQKREYWKNPFLKDGRPISWEQAMAEFRDTTGRPGPATWELGNYPAGQAEFPVGGVSWYEAAAYAEFAGKSLPTVYHWHRAADISTTADILRVSNLSGQGPARVGNFRGLGRFGTYDMAGNVKEWCWNPLGDRRYILGGGWTDGSYLFAVPDARRPFERLPTHGFRCAKYLGPIAEALTGPVEFISRDRTRDKPVGDELFRVYQDLHSYDRSDLKAVVESVDETSEHWRKQRISFAAAYGNERVTAYLFLPRGASQPYQTVVYFPGAGALSTRSSQRLETPAFEFIVRGGRAVLCPIYMGTYERGPSLYYHRYGQPNLWREMNLQWAKDLRRSLDYLETRTDIDRSRLAYFGNSLGAAQGPRLTAVEPRFKASVLMAGGFFEKVPPEVDPLNFAPRSTAPVLMVNGRDDFLFPYKTSQLPMFRLLGAPEKDKRHAVFECGHDAIGVYRQQVIKEILDWLDRYLGPVKPAGQ